MLEDLSAGVGSTMRDKLRGLERPVMRSHLGWQ
jgi:hypothetical protein